MPTYHYLCLFIYIYWVLQLLIVFPLFSFYREQEQYFNKP